MRRRGATRAVLAPALILAATLAAGQPGAQIQSRPSAAPATPRAPQPRAPHDALWARIAEIRDRCRSTSAAQAGFERALELRRELHRLTRSYLALYPGGRHRDQAVRLELRALFEIGTLDGGAFQPLCERVAEYLQHPPSEAGLWEAEYWNIVCRRLGSPDASTGLASMPASGRDDTLLAAYRDYVARYPRSPYVLRMSSELFEDATRRGDLTTEREIVQRLRRDFPEHAATARLAAQLRRQQATGQPLRLRATAVDGTQIDTAAWRGRPVLIVVWASFSDPALDRVKQVETFRRQHPETVVVGVNLDGAPEAMHSASREADLPWPQINDGLGWANPFALEWGVRELPFIFVLDREGNLLGATPGAEWRELAAKALQN